MNYTRISSVELLDVAANLERNSCGVAVQAGVNVKTDEKWSLNFDVKNVRIRSDVKSAGASISRVKVDPLLVGVGIGYRF